MVMLCKYDNVKICSPVACRWIMMVATNLNKQSNDFSIYSAQNSQIK